MEVAIHTSSGNSYNFLVEVADTPELRSCGLMHRYSMPANHGMLFKFDRDHIITMWMKNTRISLDMLFIDVDGYIVDLYKNAEPLSETLIKSKNLARSVLELNGGTIDRLGIGYLDRIYLGP